MHTPAEVDREADLRVTLAGLLHVGTERVTYRNLTPEIASIDEATGQLTRVADGTARIVVGTRYIKKLVEAEMLRESGQTVQVFNSWVEGTLAEACAAAIDDRISGLTGDATTMKIRDRDAAGYNASCWAADIDLTCMRTQIPMGTLISPRHLIGAEHYRPGGACTFMRADGSTVQRTIIARQNVGPANATDDWVTDLTVCLLDSDVPAGINFAKVVPANIADYFSQLQHRVPLLIIDRNLNATVADLRAPLAGDFVAAYNTPPDPARASFFRAADGPDSGCPIFLVDGVEPILLGTLTYNFLGGVGPNVAMNIDAINTAIAAVDVAQGVSTGYSLTVANWSGVHPTFGGG